jgi:UDP:flavonoid glycosyltransferase YjiC (YdhE family)
MRVLMTTTGYPGHVRPLLPFAVACWRAGHDVCIAGPARARAMVGELGLDYCPCADPPEDEIAAILAAAGERDPSGGHAVMTAEGFAGVAARALLPDLLQVVGAWRPHVVVRESLEFSGALAAERHGIPHLRVALGLASTEEQTVALAAPALAPLRAELGLPADPGGERLRAAPSLTLVPAGFDVPGGARQAPHRFREARTQPGPLPDWWPGNADPLVLLTFGSVAGELGYFPALYRAACEALAGAPIRVLVTVGADCDPADLGPLPANVHAERWVPQEDIAAHAAAVVCHGGSGSLLGALAHGLPAVAVPLFAGDQWDNAQRLADVGAGIRLAGPRRRMFEHPGADVLAALPGALLRVLEKPAHRAAAWRLAAEVETLPEVGTAPRVLRAIAARTRPAPPEMPAARSAGAS